MTLPLLVNAAWPRSAGPHGVEAAELAVSAEANGLALPESPRLFADPLVLTERVLAITDVSLGRPCVLAPDAALLCALFDGAVCDQLDLDVLLATSDPWQLRSTT